MFLFLIELTLSSLGQNEQEMNKTIMKMNKNEQIYYEHVQNNQGKSKTNKIFQTMSKLIN